MFAQTLLAYQLGREKAIRGIASNRSSLITGALLVLLTGIPRNYDQFFIFESPWLFIGPLLFSSISGSFVFAFIYPVFIRPKLEKPKPSLAQQYLGFMGLFWMTAPVAWIYALPVERFLDPYNATVANLWLLGIVAIWRVILLARVLSITHEASFWHCLIWVSLPASLEVVLLFIFSGPFAQSIARGMGGMRNSPEENLQLDVFSAAFLVCFWSFVVMMIAAAIFRNRKPMAPILRSQWEPVPWKFLVGTLAIMIALSIYPQVQAWRNYRVDSLFKNGRIADALKYMSRHQPTHFLPARRFSPDPYDYEVWEGLPEVILHMDGSEAAWVRALYFKKMESMMEHRFISKPEAFKKMIEKVERLPGGEEWLHEHRSRIDKLLEKNSQGEAESKAALHATANTAFNAAPELGKIQPGVQVLNITAF